MKQRPPGENLKGLLVTFEGVEGSGKSTLISLVHSALAKKNIALTVTREPGGSDLGKSLRKALLDPAAAAVSPIAELFLYAADRAQHVNDLIVPALTEGKVVLCDRFSDATIAYQGHGRGLPLDVVREVDRTATGGLKPDLTVLLDITAEAGIRRARSRNERDGTPDESRFDDEALPFHRSVREGYLAISGSEPERFLILDGMLPPEELAVRVVSEITARLKSVSD